MSSYQNDLHLPNQLKDLLPNDHQFFTYIKKVVRHRCRQSGLRRISTPIFEQAAILEKIFDAQAINHSDSNSFLACQNIGGDKIIARPNLIPGIARSYLQHEMKQLPKPVKFYSIEPCFIDGKKGLSQFHQYMLCLIGEEDPVLDAQLINTAHIIHNDLDIANQLELQINNLGCPLCLPQYLEDLSNYYYGKERTLCHNCQNFKDTSPLKLLTCQEEDCQILAKMAPTLDKYLCSKCKKHHAALEEFLRELKLDFIYNTHLVPELNFYNSTYFEFCDKQSKKQIGLTYGGRFDYLLSTLGGENTPAVGFSSTIEMIVGYMKRQGIKVPYKDDVHVFLAQLGPKAKKRSLSLLNQLRNAGIKTIGALGTGNFKDQLELAAKFDVPYALLLGQMEVIENTIILRDMRKGKQRIIPFKEAVPELKKILGESKLDKYDQRPDGMIW